MKNLLKTAILLVGLCLSTGAAWAAVDEVFHTGSTTVTAGTNSITIDNNVKYINYQQGDSLLVTLDYSANCNVVINGVALRNKGFTPKGVAGSLTNISGTPAFGIAATSGSVTFNLAFTSLKKAGLKNFGMAHLTLSLNADANCDGLTTETPVNVGVQISVSTADHP